MIVFLLLDLKILNFVL